MIADGFLFRQLRFDGLIPKYFSGFAVETEVRAGEGLFCSPGGFPRRVVAGVARNEDVVADEHRAGRRGPGSSAFHATFSFALQLLRKPFSELTL